MIPNEQISVVSYSYVFLFALCSILFFSVLFDANRFRMPLGTLYIYFKTLTWIPYAPYSPFYTSISVI